MCDRKVMECGLERSPWGTRRHPIVYQPCRGIGGSAAVDFLSSTLVGTDMNNKKFEANSYGRGGRQQGRRRPDSTRPNRGRSDFFRNNSSGGDLFSRRGGSYSEPPRGDYGQYKDDIPSLDPFRRQDQDHKTTRNDYNPFRDTWDAVDQFRRPSSSYPEPFRDDFAPFRDDAPAPSTQGIPSLFSNPILDNFTPFRDDLSLAGPHRRSGPFPEPFGDNFGSYRDDLPIDDPLRRFDRYPDRSNNEFPSLWDNLSGDDRLRRPLWEGGRYPESSGGDYDPFDDFRGGNQSRRPVRYPDRSRDPYRNALPASDLLRRPGFSKRYREDDYDYQRGSYGEYSPPTKMRRTLASRLGDRGKRDRMRPFSRRLGTRDDRFMSPKQQLPEGQLRQLKAAIAKTVAKAKSGKGTLADMPDKPPEVSFKYFKKLIAGYGIGLNKNKFYFIEDKKVSQLANATVFKRKKGKKAGSDTSDIDDTPLIREEKELEEGQVKTLISPDPDMPLFVLIAHQAYPSERLSKKQVRDVTQKLIELGRKDRTFKDFSLRPRNIDGVILIKCSKRSQYNWIITSIPFANKRAGVPIKSLEPRQLKLTASYMTRMYAPEIPRETMSLLLNTQNEGLDSSNWNFTLERTTDFARLYKIEVDEVSAELIKYWRSHVFYGTERLRLRRVFKAKGKGKNEKDEEENDNEEKGKESGDGNDEGDESTEQKEGEDADEEQQQSEKENEGHASEDDHQDNESAEKETEDKHEDDGSTEESKAPDTKDYYDPMDAGDDDKTAENTSEAGDNNAPDSGEPADKEALEEKIEPNVEEEEESQDYEMSENKASSEENEMDKNDQSSHDSTE